MERKRERKEREVERKKGREQDEYRKKKGNANVRWRDPAFPFSTLPHGQERGEWKLTGL